MSELKPATAVGDFLTAKDSTSTRLRLMAVFAAGYAALALPAIIFRNSDISSLGMSAFLAGALIILSAIDAVSFRLPDVLTLPLIAVGLVATWWLDWDHVEYRAAAALVGYVTLWLVAFVYLRFRRRPGLGLGDAKLFAAGGAWLGYDGLPTVLLYASLFALVVVALILGRSATSQLRLPFGPFIAFGIWVVWLYGTPNFWL